MLWELKENSRKSRISVNLFDISKFIIDKNVCSTCAKLMLIKFISFLWELLFLNYLSIIFLYSI